MYSYTYDETTGGILLNSTPLSFSKEPRPVYYMEMDILGFDSHWQYEKNDAYPYMWAEANNYFYRGRLVAKTKGGLLYSKPEVTYLDSEDPIVEPLQFIDVPAMVEKNLEILNSLVQTTIKDVFNTYVKYKNKVDAFHVSFSGGKDSVVTLDIVQKALPHNAFFVIFGDTQMEFPDTYTLVENIKNKCSEDGIKFYIAQSKLNPECTWRAFGPPSKTIRWCCSVHKTAPQLLLLRDITGLDHVREMAFVGVRRDESLRRSEYDYVSFGTKHKGQYSCNPIIEWNSAEVYLYIYANNLLLNDAYKKGNSRAGCLICPMSGELAEYFRNITYPYETEKFLDLVREKNARILSTKEDTARFINIGGWKQRSNGRDILTGEVKYHESKSKTSIEIELIAPRTPWREWIKTLGTLTDSSHEEYCLNGPLGYIQFEVLESPEKTIVKIPISFEYQHATLIKMLKQVFRKAAYCIQCQECEADCPMGNIKMDPIRNVLEISEACTHCGNCHKPDSGCLLYHSLVLPKGDGKMDSKQSLDCYADHAPKKEWIKSFFELQNDFLRQHTLGSMMFSMFKKFLRHAELLDNNCFSKTAEILAKIGMGSPSFWGILLVNLSYTPEIGWFVKKVPFNENISREYLQGLLQADGVKDRGAKSISGAYKRFLSLPFGEMVGMGEVLCENDKYTGLRRGRWENPEPLVILYSLYKFAEACKDYYQFTLSRLLDHDIESDGVSPTQIFGLDRESMEKILNGLAINYPDFISVSFNLDLDNITLRNDKTAADVLNLL